MIVKLENLTTRTSRFGLNVTYMNRLVIIVLKNQSQNILGMHLLVA